MGKQERTKTRLHPGNVDNEVFSLWAHPGIEPGITHTRSKFYTIRQISQKKCRNSSRQVKTSSIVNFLKHEVVSR